MTGLRILLNRMRVSFSHIQSMYQHLKNERAQGIPILQELWADGIIFSYLLSGSLDDSIMLIPNKSFDDDDDDDVWTGDWCDSFL